MPAALQSNKSRASAAPSAYASVEKILGTHLGVDNPIQLHAHKVGLPEKIFLHAEMDAIIKCRNMSKAHKIVVTRVTRSGKYGNAKPCPVCKSAIKEAGIKNVEWTV